MRKATTIRDGASLAEAKIAPGHTAEEKDGQILVDGESLYLEAGTVSEAIKNRDAFKSLKTPVTTADALISEDGTSILYHGTYQKEPSISIGDIQQRAKSIISVMLALDV